MEIATLRWKQNADRGWDTCQAEKGACIAAVEEGPRVKRPFAERKSKKYLTFVTIEGQHPMTRMQPKRRCEPTHVPPANVREFGFLAFASGFEPTHSSVADQPERAT